MTWTRRLQGPKAKRRKKAKSPTVGERSAVDAPNADAEDLDPAPQEEASTDGGLDDDAATDSDSESDGDEAAWAAADGLTEDHRALRVQGLAWDGIPQNRRRRVWLERSGASRRAGDPTVPPPELLKETEELENVVGSRIAADGSYGPC